jgi:BMFP domain-containing protein YqiC
MTRNPFDEISERLGRLLPEGAQEMRADFERNARSVMHQTMHRMDLITREEFDVQADVLARTREQVTALENRVAQLEREAGLEPPASTSDSPADPEYPPVQPILWERACPRSADQPKRLKPDRIGRTIAAKAAPTRSTLLRRTAPCSASAARARCV